MKRIVWGTILVVFGLLCLASAGNNPQGPTGSIVVGLMCLAGGGALANFGIRHVKAERAIAEAALVMLKQHGRIDASDLAQGAHLSEVTSRQYIVRAQRAGIIPFNAQVV